MKTHYFLSILFALLMASLPSAAQTTNRLYTPDIKSLPGSTVSLPVLVQNEDDIVAVQFTLQVPEGVSLKTSSVSLSERKDDHTVTFRSLGNSEYMCVVYSPSNLPLKGNSGELLSVELAVPASFSEGSTHEFSLRDAVLSKRDGSNALTSASTGVLTILQRPDLEVSNVSVTETSVNPGGSINVSWQISNLGTMATQAGWTEQVYLVQSDNASVLLGTTSYDNTIGGGLVVSRQATLTLPSLPGIDGAVNVKVEVTPEREVDDSELTRENNVALSSATLDVGRKLLLSLPSASVEESAGSVRCMISRSGNRSESQFFTIESTADSRVTIPTSIVIPAGQSAVNFNIELTDNKVLDANQVIEIKVSGNGYEAVSGSFIIEDNEYPDLTVTASSVDITEGQTFQLTISTNRVTNDPVEVTINSENTTRFSFPAKATIPAGENSVTVTVTAVNDDIADMDISNAFTVYADRHNKGEVLVVLTDDDMPDIELILTPSEVSEGAGPQSVMGTVRRTSNIDKRITVKLSDNAPEGALFYTQKTLEMQPGVAEMTFTMGPVDNSKVDGERVYTITAGTYVSSCSCVVGSTTGNRGIVNTQLTILDDDGEALSMTASASVVKEGESITLTISRNTVDVSSEVAVTLSSDYDDNLVYDKNVVIPAGSASVDVVITSQRNEVDNDNRTVTMTAKAEGFIKSTHWFLVTDQTQPDATIHDLTLSGESVYAGSKVGMSVVVDNIGFAVLKAPIKVNVYSGLSSAPLATLSCNDDIAEAGSYTFRGSFIAPQAIRNTYIYAVVNESQTQKELLNTNNTTERVHLNIMSPFTATVQTDASIYEPGSVVTISGQLAPAQEALPIAQQEIEVYVINNDNRQTLSATTDEQGRFSTQFTTLNNQTGHFKVGACYPGANQNEEMAGFDIYGLKLANYNPITVECAVGDPYTLNIPLSNPCSQPLTGLTASVVSAPEGCDINLSVPETIEAGKLATLTAEITGSVASEELKWYDISLKVQTAEGASLDIPVNYYCASQKPSLSVVGNQQIALTLPEGFVTEYGVTITNKGKGETGPITLTVPDLKWLEVATPTKMASLAQNDSATIVFRMNPTDILELNMSAFATIGINCESGIGGTYVRFDVVPVATNTGNLHVVVGDEFTYNTEEAPYVAGASVTLQNPSTGAIVASGVTNEQGIFDAEVLAGYYTLTVEAEKHDKYTSTIFIEASRTNNEDVYLPYQSITIDWTVEETQILDEYKLVTTVEYETNFPSALVVWTFPENIPEENHIFYASCTNKGKLPAKDIDLVLPESNDRLTFIPLDVTHYDLLKPESTLLFPVQVKVVESSGGSGGNSGTGDDPGDGGNQGSGNQGSGNQGSGDQGNNNNPGDNNKKPCITRTYIVSGNCKIPLCKTEKDTLWIFKNYEYKYVHQEGDCSSKPSGSVSISTGGGGGGGIGGPGGGGGGWYSGGSGACTASTHIRNCNHCEVQALRNLVDCAGQWIPYYECAKDAYLTWKSNGNYGKTAVCIIKETVPGLSCASNGMECAKNSYNQGGELTNDQMDQCLDALIGDCVGEVIPVVSWIWKAKKCWDLLTKPCDAQTNSGDSQDSNVKQFQAMKEKVMKRAGAVLPSYMTAFYNNTIPIINAADAIHSIFVDRYGDEEWTQSPAEQVKLLYYTELEQPQDATPEQLTEALLPYRPDNINMELFNRYIERLYNSRLIAKGQTVESDNHRDHELWVNAMETIAQAQTFVMEQGYGNVGEFYSKECDTFIKKVEEASDAVCATITLSFNQKMTMTRQAFRGTLTVTNGNETTAMTDVRLNLEVKDTEGNVATSQKFQINVESLSNFEGEMDLQAGWTLGAKEKGIATVLFIPTKYAAPTEPMDYSFGGTLTYVDPYTGLEVTRELSAVTLTVKPSPNLDLDYFMQRDVFGDDPFTDEIEAKEEAEFALLINNIGYGDATNVRILTSQPEIVDNQKGALVNFEIVSSQLNGGDKTLALNSSVMSDFGTIAAHSTAYAQWWLTCDVLGHFVSYDVEATHVTSYGNPDLTLLNEVKIHELIRSIKVEDGIGFVANDLPDSDDLPDMLYFSDGTTAEVSVATQAEANRQSNTEYLLTIVPTTNGWNYGCIADPSSGKAKLIGIKRQSDGKEINLRNFWQTDRTLRDGKLWLNENKLHFVDEMNGEETYVLTFEARPEKELAIAAFEGVPEPETILKDALQKVTVVFNKPIKAETFTTDDITLNCQGQRIEAPISISAVSDTEYELDLSQATLDDGYYILRVQTASILDTENFEGTDGKAASWIQFPSLQAPRIKIEDTFTLVSTASKGNQWFKDGDPIENATEQRFTPTENGVYHVVATNGLYSSEPSKQYRVQFLDEVNLTMNLLKGWNWISTNLSEEDNQDAKTFLAPLNPYADELISITKGLQKDNTYGWTGNLSTLSPQEGYKLHTTADVTHTWSGAPVEAQDINIPLYKGWNWIGYTTAAQKDLDEALATMQPSEDDVIKGFDAFATYTDGKWVGTLKTLKPGEGYLCQVAQAGTLTYPSVKVLVEEVENQVKAQAQTTAMMPWKIAANAYPDNMTMIADVYSSMGKADENHYIVGAFVGDECRGIGQYEAGKLFMTIHGNVSAAEEVHFKAYNPTLNQEAEIEERLTFGNVMHGTMKQPAALHIGRATGIETTKVGAFALYPNPVRQRLFIDGKTEDIISISIMSASGAVVLSEKSYPIQGIDVTSLSNGMYVIVITTNNGEMAYKFMKQN